jgi:hypothetical protein
MGDALHTHGGVTDAREARLAQGGLIAAHGPTTLDTRTGVLVGPGTTQLVTGTADTAPMRVAIAPHNWVTSRGAANGPYLGALEASTTVDIAAAPGSGTRTDVVWVKQQDATAGVPSPDASTAPEYGATTGTVGAGKPTIPVGAEELATVDVAAGATATNGSGVTITNTARQTVARGARIPVRNQAERDALTTHPGLEVYRLDTGQVQLRGAAAWATVTEATQPARGNVRNGATNPNGQTRVTHGLPGTPAQVFITLAGAFSTNNLTARVVTRDATGFWVASYVNNAINANGSIDFDWIAYP